MLMGSRPDAEFFEVVAHGREAARMLARGVAEKIGGLAHVAEGNQVSQGFQAGKNLDRVAQIFGGVVAEELLELEAGAEKMVVVHQRVFDAGGRQGLRELAAPRRVRQAMRPAGAL